MIIIATLAVIGGFGFIGATKYRDLQNEKKENEKLSQEVNQSSAQKNEESITNQQSEDLKKLKEEIESLKEQNVNKTPPKPTLNSPQASPDELKKLKQGVENLKRQDALNKSPVLSPSPQQTPLRLTTSEITEKYRKYIASIVCQQADGNYILGSGIVITKINNRIIILTNYHVTQNAINPLKSDAPPCIIGAYDEHYLAQPIYWPEVASEKEMMTVDFSFLEIREPIAAEYGEIVNGQWVTQNKTVPTKVQNLTAFPEICSKNTLRVGDEIVVLGYPAIGGEQSLPGLGTNIRLIVTEGIISSDAGIGTHFVGSAKIDQGNSGGGTFLKSIGCLAGMPTYVRMGIAESLGRFINLPNLKYNYLSKIIY